MINSKEIYLKANRLVEEHGTRDPAVIATNSDIEILYVDYFKNLLGLYTYKYRQRFIIVNNKIDEVLSRMVIAHELGHDIFHRDLAKKDSLREFVLFNMKNDTEYEANVFAAHLLLDTDEIITLAKNGYDVVKISNMMDCDINLTLIKMQELNRLGYNFNIPAHPDSKFFKHIPAKLTDDEYF